MFPLTYAQSLAIPGFSGRALARFGRLLGLFSVLLFPLATGLSASALTTELTATKRVITRDAQGHVVESWVPFTKLLPGEEVTYTVACTNKGTDPASDIVVQLPIPAEMLLLPGADSAGVEITYSIDGGNTFNRLDRLAVFAPDGASRPARADDVNFVRWKLTATLAANDTVKAACHVLLK